MQHAVELNDEQVRALERLAVADRRSVDELIRQAVEGYLALRRQDWSDWGDRFDALVARVLAHRPPDATSDEVEADITAARRDPRRPFSAPSRGGPPACGSSLTPASGSRPS